MTGFEFLFTFYSLLLGLAVANIATDFADFGTDLPGYGRLDVVAGWPVSPNWRIEGRIENLTGSDYELIDGYNTAGRSAFLRISYLAD